jgi:hypothetical protein
MEAAYDSNVQHDNFCKQLDAFASLQGWSRSQDEKKNKLVNQYDDIFLQGRVALLQLLYYGFPAPQV